MGVYTLLPVIAGMGVTAGLAVVAVVICRCFLKKGPKLFCYLLWGVVLFRLICPVSVPSSVSALRLLEFGRGRMGAAFTALLKGLHTMGNSFMERGEESFKEWGALAGYPGVGTGTSEGFDIYGRYYQNDYFSGNFFLGDIMAGGANDLWLAWNSRFGVEQQQEGEDTSSILLPAPSLVFLEMGEIGGKDESFSALGQGGEILDTVPTWLKAATWVWFAGIAVMFLCGFLSLFRLRRRLVGAVLLKGNIYQSDYIASPFVIGMFSPRIYLPSSLCGREQEYILLHEQTHVKRGDHIFRLLASAALVIHWFNPLAWLAFFLSGKDMEMACDEAVMRGMKKDIRAEYSASLLGLATGRHLVPGTYLAFGEGDVKSRIKNVMHYRKPTVFGVVFAAVLVSGTICAFGSDPKTEQEVRVRSEREGIGEEEGGEEKEVQRKITIYSLNDSELVRELIKGFSECHPGIEICYETGEGADACGQVDALTARLTAGMGPDLLILDGLPAELYQSKGLLTDLAEALEPVREELQQNILSAYTQDEKIFMLPVHFMVPTVLTAHKQSRVQHDKGGQGNPDDYSSTDFLKLAYYNYMPEFIREDKTVDEAEIADFLVFAKWLDDGGDFSQDYIEEITLSGISLLCGMDDLCDYAREAGELSAQELNLWSEDGTFFPEAMLGINAWSQEKELAIQFVRAVFSEKMQSEYADISGFPVNSRVFEQEFENSSLYMFKDGRDIQKDGSGSEVFGTEDKGEELVLSIKEIVVNANRGRMVDAAVLQILQEEGSAYFCGEATLADCVAAIVKRLL